MERRQVLDHIQVIVRDVLDNEDILLQEGTCTEEIDEWDSVVHMTVIAMLETEYGIEFDTEKIATAKTVEGMIDMILEKLCVKEK